MTNARTTIWVMAMSVCLCVLPAFGVYVSGEVYISGGWFDFLYVFNNAHLFISGGTIDDYLSVHDNSLVVLSGGTVGSYIAVNDTSILSIRGSNFAIDEQPSDYSVLKSISGGQYFDEPRRHLTGTLASGDSLDNDFYIGYDASIVLVPVPLVTGDFCGANFAPPDGYVDVWDLMQFAEQWHTRTGAGNWDSKFDLAGPDFGDLDGYVDVWDLMVFADHWHEGEKP